MIGASSELYSGTVSRLLAQDEDDAYLTNAADRVYPSRDLAWTDTETYPAIAVYVPGFDQNNQACAAPMMLREERVVIECHAKFNPSTCDEATLAVLALEAQVLALILKDPTWLAQFEKVLSCTTQRGRDTESAARRVISIITITVRYRPSYAYVPVDTFDGVDVVIDQIEQPANEPDGEPDIEAAWEL